MRFPRMKQTELTSEENKSWRSYWKLLFYIWLLLKILFMDLIKSRSLNIFNPKSLDTAALFSFCLYTIHSLQLIKLKKPKNKVWNKDKIICLVKKKKREKEKDVLLPAWKESDTSVVNCQQGKELGSLWELRVVPGQQPAEKWHQSYSFKEMNPVNNQWV